MKTKPFLPPRALWAALCALCAATIPYLPAQPAAHSIELLQRNAAGNDWLDRVIVPQPDSMLTFDTNRAPSVTLLSTLAKTSDLSQYAPVTALNSATSALTTQITAKAATSDLTAHTNTKSNPHAVTAAQIGLGSVNNTSDAAKPVSTAQQSAIDAAKNAAITQAATSAAQYALPARLGEKTSAIATFDTITATGFYSYYTILAGSQDSWMIFHKESTNGWAEQIASGLYSGSIIHRRRDTGGVWYGWERQIYADAPADGKRYVRKNNAWVSLD